MQVIQQTDEEKMAMYMKMPKKKLAEMLIQCNKVLDAQYRGKVFSSNAVLAVSLPTTCQFLNRSGVFEKCPNVNVCELCRQ